MNKMKQLMVLFFPICIHCLYYIDQASILRSIVLGTLVGVYIVLMKEFSRKARIQMATLHTVFLLGVLLFYVFYPFCPVAFKKASAGVYKFFMESRYELFFFGGVSLGMMGRWKELELCPYQLLRTIILFSFPLITLGIFYLQNYFNLGATNGLSTFLYNSCFVLWGLQTSIYTWMSLRLTKENQRLLLLGHISLFGVVFTILGLFNFTEYHYSYFLRTWGFMSLVYYVFHKNNKFISNS